jgi:hypothetical protein
LSNREKSADAGMPGAPAAAFGPRFSHCRSFQTSDVANQFTMSGYRFEPVRYSPHERQIDVIGVTGGDSFGWMGADPKTGTVIFPKFRLNENR